jgi:hypothetical protein
MVLTIPRGVCMDGGVQSVRLCVLVLVLVLVDVYVCVCFLPVTCKPK